MTFQEERLSEMWADALPLIEENVKETGASKTPRVCKKTYESLEEKGLIRVYTARSGGSLVGYCSMIMNVHPHFGEPWAIQDALFVSKSFRGPSAYKFMKFVDKCLIELGAVKIIRQVTKFKDYARTLESFGYSPIETVYMRSV